MDIGDYLRSNDATNYGSSGTKIRVTKIGKYGYTQPNYGNIAHPTEGHLPTHRAAGRRIPNVTAGVTPTFNRPWQGDSVSQGGYAGTSDRRRSRDDTPSLGESIVNYATARSQRKNTQRLADEQTLKEQQDKAAAYQKENDDALNLSKGTFNYYNEQNAIDIAKSAYPPDPFGKQLTKRTPDAFGNVRGYSRSTPPNTTPFPPTENPWQQVADKVTATRVPQFIDPSVAAKTRPMLSQTPFPPTTNPWQQVADKVDQQRSFSGQVSSQLNNPSVANTGINAGKAAYSESGENKEALNLASGAYLGSKAPKRKTTRSAKQTN